MESLANNYREQMLTVEMFMTIQEFGVQKKREGVYGYVYNRLSVDEIVKEFDDFIDELYEDDIIVNDEIQLRRLHDQVKDFDHVTLKELIVSMIDNLWS